MTIMQVGLWKVIGKAFLLSFGWYVLIFPPLIVYKLVAFACLQFKLEEITVIPIVFAILQLLIFLSILKEDISNLIQSIYRQKEVDLKRRESLFEEKCKKQNLSLELARNKINIKEEKLKSLLQSATPFKDSSTMLADMKAIFFDENLKYLTYKRHPAGKSSKEVVRKCREITKNAEQKYAEMKYKFEFLVNAIPQIADYVDDEQDLLSINEDNLKSNSQDCIDRRRCYLSLDEFNKLSDIDRNQLALDRYLTAHKTPWQIGRDYELCCAWELEKKGYMVERNGIKKGFNDMGIDLIAYRNIHCGEYEVLLIQCKCWKSKRVIRENIVFQLYGSALSYEIDKNKNNLLSKDNYKKILMVPDFSELSDVAKLICERLKIEILKQPITDFPRIKCNINRGERIYHLPFDQKYDETEICKDGEFYAWTVAEAESKGFRRAYRWNGLT